MFYFALVSTLVGAIVDALFDFHPIDWEGGWLLLGVGTFGTAAQLVMTRAYKRGNTLVSASLGFYSTVIFASLFGMLFWREALSAAAWSAIALIVASGVISSWLSRANPADQD